MNTNLADIVEKIASQGKNPDVSFLKDNPEAQTMLLLALLSSSNTTNNNDKTNNQQTNNNNLPTPVTSPTSENTEKRKFDTLVNISPSPSSSPTSLSNSSKPKRVGRKLVTSEEEDSDNPKSKRKAQNRAAQRAFRERKENHVRVLEERVKDLEKQLDLQNNTSLVVENEQLKNIVKRLKDENARLLGHTASFDLPLSSQTQDGARPQKIVRSSFSSNNNSDASPVSHFDSLSSNYSTSSRSNTPPPSRQLTIDDILGVDQSSLPSNALIDHSELLGLSGDQLKSSDYSTQLDDILNQHRFPFTTDPSQFDFFYPLHTQDALEPTPEKKNIAQTWDKISEHPRFGEFDMDSLCDEMKKKATCEEYDHDKELEKLVNEIYPVE
ncbi:uncharacterized protein B0P05DRAFT_538314 [Gilbertella persicaria]|uniref:uncharacterized protein n=1 Tax=Gilbertella persicaria TaxID=101096 RepID=UPI0022202021|nr:uncharacterized protein B0P05DRAFT_538314 [Gilbertella persicaria]KAI8081852.1 hypothetical protein B0P05DRAFT_538314 [Gilbertella persicaria]